MAKIGRNDPCPCGSGKKFKKCCFLKGDEALKAVESKVIDEQLRAWAQAEPPERPREAGPHRAVFSEQIKQFEHLLNQEGESGKETVYFAAEELFSSVETREERDELHDCFERFRKNHPKLYAMDAVLYARRLIDDDLQCERAERTMGHFLTAADHAEGDVEMLIAIVSQLEYHGELKTLLHGMRRAWPKIEANEAIMEWVKAEFAAGLFFYEICAWLEKLEGCSADEAELISRLHEFHFREDFAKRCILQLSVSNTAQWEKEDPSLLLNDHQRTTDLMNDFHAWLRREEAVSWTKAQLASHHIESYLYGRHTGELKTRPLSKGKPPEHALSPDFVTLEEYVSRLFDFMASKPYDCAALFEVLPSWLRFLELVGLLGSEQRQRTLREVKPLVRSIIKLLSQHDDSERLSRAVAARWVA